MAARRAQQAKQSLASSSNLSTLASNSTATLPNSLKENSTRARLKSTSMTNLVANQTNSTSTSNLHQASTPRLQRPASRNALDNIHKGMNSKFTHVQSKVLLQNIRPQQQNRSSKIPATPKERLTPATPSSTLRRSTPTPAGGAKIQQSDRSQLINKIKSLQEELERHERQRDEMKLELERERSDKTEQVQQMKFELQERVAESERQNDEYHQKLLEAYELADQNRRAADSVLSESRQREEELRKKIDELEQQLNELREFVQMKEEMMGKMGEMREQIRVERERYEEKTRSLHQMFENEKIRSTPSHKLAASNYFGRAKPSLQSAESINRLDGSCQQLDQTTDSSNRQRHNRSQDDLYGSKLSTRMQDGARLAWKKSRKFASSVITNGLGGLSACRKHNLQQSASGSGSRRQTAASCREESDQHTSVVEVGATVGDFNHNQQQELMSKQHEQQPTNSGLIRVDENNKLTIVTKFSDQTVALRNQEQELHNQQQHLVPKSSPDSCERSSSERSRCESSSSGRGTASDSGESHPGSQNGDHSELELNQQRDGAIRDETSQNSLEAPPRSQTQRHKRKSSLFKANAFSGSQASLNKTFKSFFALASSKANGSPANGKSQNNTYEVPFDATTTAQVQADHQKPNGQPVYLAAAAFDETAVETTSLHRNCSLTNSDRTITDETTTNQTAEDKNSTERTTSSTTAKILDELVRYGGGKRDDETLDNNNEPRATTTTKSDANEIGRKCGQGDQRADELSAFAGHEQQLQKHQRAVVAVEH